MLPLLACAPENEAIAAKDSRAHDGSRDTDDTDDPDDTDDTDDTASGCRSGPPPSGDRAVVVSFPYDRKGNKANTWQVLALSGTTLTEGASFEMGRGYSGVVSFSADGSLGAVAQDDGTLGVFTLDADLEPTVVEAAWTPGFYASAVVFDPSGERAWVVDGNWANNGGGLYEVAFDCETGAPALVGQVMESKLASALFVDGTDAVLVADAAGGESGGHAWMLAGWPTPTVVSGVTLFDYEDSISAGSAVAGGVLLVGDNSEFSGEDNRVSVAGLEPLEKTLEFTLLDPFAMVASPWGDAVLVSSGYGDAI